MDPTNHLHLIINFHDNCSAGHNPVCFAESKDGGGTWSILEFPVSLKNQWGEGTAVLPIDETHWLYEYWELYYTSDAGKNWVKAYDAPDVQGPFFQVPKGNYFVATQGGMLTSSDGATWSPIANSGHALDAVIGDDSRLFALAGFQPPTDDQFVWAASYEDTAKWTLLDTTALPSPLPGGGTSLGYDPGHRVLYVAAQQTGLWRMVTK
jgi:hypothetical protein